MVYKIPFKSAKAYIGETGRPVQDRIEEHERASDSPVPRPPPFQSRLTTQDTTLFGMK